MASYFDQLNRMVAPALSGPAPRDLTGVTTPTVRQPTGFFQHNAQYGQGDKDWTKTPFVTDMLDPLNPQGVWTAHLSRMGMGGQDKRSQYGQSLYGKAQGGYAAALREFPGLTFRDYLRKQLSRPQLDNMWLNLTPGQRGERPTQFAPSSRIIGWG